MPRQARLVLPDVAMHVVQRGHNRQACFKQETDYVVYLSLLHQWCRKAGCALHAYCLMTDHVHLLLTPASEHACAALMRNLGQQYVQYFNRRYGRSGTLWEGRFRSCLVDSTRYVLACYRYIELNPVRAGMVPTASGYRWSSHHSNAGRAQDELLSPHPEYLALSTDEARRYVHYAALFNGDDAPGFLSAIREATNGGFPLLGEKLKAQVTAMGRRLEPKKPGPLPQSTESAGASSGELEF